MSIFLYMHASPGLWQQRYWEKN